MGRSIKNWKPDRVADAVVAPHRYRWDGSIRPDGSLAVDLADCTHYEEVKKNRIYVEGEVVYVDCGAEVLKARIIQSTWECNPFGDRRGLYRVQYETKKGMWSKSWEWTHPGPIQRGYTKKGLAPDMVGKI